MKRQAMVDVGQVVREDPVREDIIGAALVVGGGIAGMQASLDLADAGYKVYLVEKKSAIGGHMAQLDKTFPTNDCAMCTISPRLVDVGRHLNVELLTDAEVTGLDGVAGNFKATVRIKPRFIDLERCNGCGECATVCPVSLNSTFDEGLSNRRAAYKLYPQATPDGFAIEKRGLAPCRDACPIGQRAQGYIALIAAGRYDEAYRTIKQENPFPAICGRVCNAACEAACSRAKIDEPIAIRALKRFVTDQVHARPRAAPGPAERRFDEPIAVIGAGPAGLTAAQDLCLAGYPVTVFEALGVAGGMLRVGIPEYRLPARIIDAEIQDILDLGVELKLGTRVESLDALFAEGFKAVLIAVGAHEGIRLPIPGNDLDRVLINTPFLRDVRLPEGDPARQSDPAAQVRGRRVLVLGGGDVACDVARTALRLGASEVHMACLESRAAMPASERELRGALEEGIVLHDGHHPLRLVDDGRGGVAGLECERIRSFSFDETGRPVVDAEADSVHVLDCDVFVFSVGQKAGLGFLPDDAGVALTAGRTVAIDRSTCATGRPGVFAAGDSVSGTAFVIDAVAGGHRAAETISRYLRGEPLTAPTPEQPVATLEESDLDRRVLEGEIEITPAAVVPEVAIAARAGGFGEVESGYSEDQAVAEAKRCLACGVCSECLACSFACGVDAVDLEMVETTREIDIGAVVLAPGYQVYRAELSEEYGFGRYPNVITSLQHERLLSASGPTNGHVQRPSDGQTPKKIAFLQCVGSRDQTHDYCSAVCCMSAAKQSIMAKEHEPDTEIRIFMMEMRAFAKGYESYYQRAREKYGVGYTRCRISSVKEEPGTRNLIIRYLDSDGEGAGEITEESFEMVVLSVGMEISESVRELGRKLDVELDDYGFCQTVQFDPLQTSRAGIYAVGPFREPKDIAESLVEASGAAAAAGGLLSQARWSLTRDAEYPAERDISDEEAKIAVFVCHCGTNIAGYLDVLDVADYARSLPGVIHAEDNVYACSQDSIVHIGETLKQTGANRVVIASCTPLTHEPLFQSVMRSAGLNSYLIDMANIRNQCSWVHAGDWDGATAKAKDLVRMSAARTSMLEPLTTARMVIEKAALVIGGGVAGMTVALTLAEQGFPVHLLEQSAALGGNLRHLHFGLHEHGIGADLKRNGRYLSPPEYLGELEAEIERSPLITLHLETELGASTGFMGNFSSSLRRLDGNGEAIEINHGVTILATGGVEYRGQEYGYGSDRRITTQQQFEADLAELADGRLGDDRPAPDEVVMIQCVGPATRYCGRICCTSALKNALTCKRLRPESRITIIYKDIRVYGFKERLYTEAREAGIVFVRYDDARPPEVTVAGEAAALRVRAHEPILGREIEFRPDLVVLSTPVVPSPAAQDVARRLKVPVDMDGFFMEAHAKLRPMDFLSEGIFMAGMAHYPKLLDETIIHAKAAASRAATVLAQDTIATGGKVAEVDQALCVGCLTCVRTCAYGAARIRADLMGVGEIPGAALIEPALCQGCGLCVAACPNGAIDLRHFTNDQVMAKVAALFEHQAEPGCGRVAGFER